MRICFALLVSLAVAPAALAQPVKSPLAPVPTDSFLFVTVNVGKLWDNPDFKPLRDWFAAQKVGPTDEMFGLPAESIDRVTLFLPALNLPTYPLTLVTTKKPYSAAKLMEALGTRQTARIGIAPPCEVAAIDSPTVKFVVLVDARTLLFVPDARDEGAALAGLLGQVLTKKADGPLAAALAAAAKHDIALGLNMPPLAGLIEGFERDNAVPYRALLKARTVTFTADFDKTARGKLTFAFADAADAKAAAPVLKDGIATFTRTVEEELARKPPPESVTPAILKTLVPVLKAAKVETAGANVVATADMPHADAVTALAAALPKSYAGAINSTKGLNNLKQLALGMHNFHDANNALPSDVVGTNAWSWRVQLLPYLEQQHLYKQLDFTKAWDDPANLKKLEAMEMPKVFEIPGRPAPKGHTYFRVFSRPKGAKGTERPLFVQGEKGPKLVEITDGTSNTLMIVEAGEAVPWYKPDVLAYDGTLPLPQLGAKDADRFIAARADGSVFVLKPSKLGEKTLRALITPDGGEVVTLP